ncbi:MAG: DMT family transporter [Lysobacterales bacterium]
MVIGWGEFFALASALVWALAIITFRRIGETLPAFELNLFKNCVGLVLLVPTLLFVEGAAMPDYSATDLSIALLSGFIGIAVADTWYLRALHLMGASRTGIVASLLSPFVILLSVTFLGESLVGLQLAGFAMVMSGILLVTWRSNRREVEPEQVRKGVLFGVGAVFLMAVGVVMVKEILETRPFMWTATIRLVGGIAGMLVYILLRGRTGRVVRAFRQPQPWFMLVGGSVMATYLSMIMWLAGYMLIPASVASVLNESANAWIVVLAWLLLGEPLGGRKLVGLALTSAGVTIMLLA